MFLSEKEPVFNFNYKELLFTFTKFSSSLVRSLLGPYYVTDADPDARNTTQPLPSRNEGESTRVRVHAI